eukprot:SAG11_NODE_186_length_13142_cov_17.515679_2_plen_86_part_00
MRHERPQIFDVGEAREEGGDDLRVKMWGKQREDFEELLHRKAAGDKTAGVSDCTPAANCGAHICEKRARSEGSDMPNLWVPSSIL